MTQAVNLLCLNLMFFLDSATYLTGSTLLLHQRCSMISNNYFTFFIFRSIVKQHVGILRQHTPKTGAGLKKWEKVLNCGGNFKMSMSTKVCSNHFAAGYCSSECMIPALFLKGYDVPCGSKRSSSRKRLSETQSFFLKKQGSLQDRVRQQ